MKWLKIGSLLLLVLALMRLCSWGLGWILTKLLRANVKTSAIVSNGAACFLYVMLLYWDLQPGEPVDTSAVLFGFAVFAAYATTDLFWTPWKAKVFRRSRTAG